MASELGGAKEIVVGGVVGGTFVTVYNGIFNTLEGRLKQLEQLGGQTKVLRGSVDEAVRLGREFEQLEDKGSRYGLKLKLNLDELRTSLKNQDVDVANLGDTYKSLGRVLEGIEQQKSGLQSITDGTALVGKAKAQSKAVLSLVQVAADFDSKAASIIDKVGLRDPVTRKEEKQNVSETANSISRETGMSSTEAVSLVGQLVDQGMNLKEARELAPSAARFSVSQGVDQKDAVKLVAELAKSDVKSSGDMDAVLGGFAAQAQGSDLRIAEMTQAMIKLLPEMAKKDLKGVDAALQLGAVTQVQASGGADPDGGVAKVKGLIETLNSGDRASVPEQVKAAMTSTDGRANYDAAMEKSRNGAQTLKDHMDGRSADPSVQLKVASNAIDNLKQDYAAILLPGAGEAAKHLTTVVQVLNDLMNSCKPVVQVVSVAAMGVSALGGALGAFKVAKGVVDVGRGMLNQSSDTADGKGKTSVVTSLFKIGLQSMGLGGADSSSNEGDATGALATAKAGPIDVFVVNIGDVAGRLANNKTAQQAQAAKPKAKDPPERSAPAGAQKKVTPAKPAKPADVAVADVGHTQNDKSRVAGSTEATGSASASNHASQPIDAPPRPPATTAGLSGGLGFSSSAAPKSSFSLNPKALLKRLPAVNWVDAALTGWDIYQNATDPEAKAEGLGAVAGNLGGSLGGASAGAALGTLIFPGVGTVVGGLLGAALGGMAGEEAGGQVAKVVASLGSNVLSQATGEATHQDSAPDAAETRRGDKPSPEQEKPARREIGEIARSIAADYFSTSVLPVLTGSEPAEVGTLVEGLIGAALREVAGEEVGNQLSKVIVDIGSTLARQSVATDASVDTAHVVSSDKQSSARERSTGQEAGDVARSITAAAVPPVSTSNQPAAATTPSAQNFTVSPNISITVQGSITSPSDLLRILQPEIQRMFANLAARASSGRQVWDEPAVTQMS